MCKFAYRTIFVTDIVNDKPVRVGYTIRIVLGNRIVKRDVWRCLTGTFEAFSEQYHMNTSHFDEVVPIPGRFILGALSITNMLQFVYTPRLWINIPDSRVQEVRVGLLEIQKELQVANIYAKPLLTIAPDVNTNILQYDSAYEVLTNPDLLHLICSFQTGIRGKDDTVPPYVWLLISDYMFNWLPDERHTRENVEDTVLVACARGNVSVVSKLMSMFPTQCIDIFGNHIAMQVAMSGPSLTILNLVHSHYTPKSNGLIVGMRVAIMHGQIENVQLLWSEYMKMYSHSMITVGADLAAAHGQLNLVRWFEQSPQDGLVTYAGFVQACKYGHLNIVIALLDRFMNQEMHSHLGMMEAIQGGYVEIIEALAATIELPCPPRIIAVSRTHGNQAVQRHMSELGLCEPSGWD